MEYYFVSTELNWNGAQSFCQDHNATLASSIGSSEFAALQGVVHASIFSVGARASHSYGGDDFEWERSGSEEAIVYSFDSSIANWGPDQPAEVEGTPGCVAMWDIRGNPDFAAGNLFHVSCDDIEIPFVCEAAIGTETDLGDFSGYSQAYNCNLKGLHGYCRGSEQNVMAGLVVLLIFCGLLLVFLACHLIPSGYHEIVPSNEPQAQAQLEAQPIVAEVSAQSNSGPSLHPPVLDTVQANERIDTDALTGLRGLVALHIAIGHFSSFGGEPPVDLLGGASMSFFYLLSGFVMTLGYGKRCIDPQQHFDFDYWTFLRNRLARLFPMYLLTNLMFLSGYFFFMPNYYTQINGGAYVTRDVLTLFGLNMFIYPFAPILTELLGSDVIMGGEATMLPTNGVSWTIQTMFIFYLTFPLVLRWIRKNNNRNSRASLFRGLYFVQLAWFVTALFLVAVPPMSSVGPGWGYWVGRAWPFGRLPVFMMGCLAAAERLDSDKLTNTVGGTALTRIQMDFYGCCCCPTAQLEEAKSKEVWRSRGGWVLGMYFSALIVPIALVVLFQGAFHILSFLFRIGFEASFPLFFVRVIMSLTYSEKGGTLYGFFTSKIMLAIGEMSFAFYLIHMMVCINLVMVGVRGFANMLASLVLSAIIGFALTEGFEKPMRNLLKKKRG